MSAEPAGDTDERPAPFHPLRLAALAALMLLGISTAAQWYARSVTLPRYCAEPEQVLERVRQVLTEERPAGDGERKAHILAARLTFLVPREGEEPLPAYLARLGRHLRNECG